MTGMRFRSSSPLISRSVSRPSLTGRLRSNTMRSGRTALAYFPCRRRKARASAPFSITLRRCWTPASARPSWIKSASAGLSSTSRISTGLLGASAGMVVRPFVREGEAERAALAGLRFDPNTAAMTFHDLLANGQADARAGVLRPGVQALEDEKNPLGMLWGDADAVIADGEDPLPALGPGADVNARRLSRLAELDGVADEVLEQLGQLGSVRQHRGQVLGADLRAALLDHRLQIGDDLTHDCRAVGQRQGVLHSARVRVGQQILDERLHAGGSVHGVGDVLVGLGIELALVALGQQFQVTGYHAQGLLQVVGGHVRELLQLGVGAC